MICEFERGIVLRIEGPWNLSHFGLNRYWYLEDVAWYPMQDRQPDLRRKCALKKGEKAATGYYADQCLRCANLVKYDIDSKDR